jgi:signal transduction histidine kinase
VTAAARRTLAGPVRVYVYALAGLSLLLALGSLAFLLQGRVARGDAFFLAGTTILIFFAAARPVELRPHVKLSLRSAPQLMAAVLMGPAGSVLAAGVGVVGGYLYHMYRGKHNLIDLLFNMSQSVLSTAASSVVYWLVSRSLAEPLGEPLALLAAAETMHLLNTLLVAGAISISGQDAGLVRTFGRLIRSDPLQYAALLVSGILAALLARDAFWAVPLLLVPLALVERTLIKQREEAERERKLQVMEEVNRLKNDFIAGVTHDLRTPLMVIKGFGELLAEREDEFMDDERRAIGSINVNAERLSELIEMLLQLSELDAGMVVLRRSATDAPEVVGKVIAQVQYHAEQKGVRVDMALQRPIPALELDRARLEQVIANLVGNALKFTPKGGRIMVTLDVDETHLLLKVSDTGSGIPPEVLPHIFDRFYRVNHPDNGRRQTGGLGLAIVKSIVELHGGTIDAESTVGAGTTVTIALPRVDAPISPDEGAAAHDRALADMLTPARPLPNAR